MNSAIWLGRARYGMRTQLWQGHVFLLFQNFYLEDQEENKNMDLMEIIVTNEVIKKTQWGYLVLAVLEGGILLPELNG